MWRVSFGINQIMLKEKIILSWYRQYGWYITQNDFQILQKWGSQFPLLHRKDILHKITLIVCLMQTIGNYSFDDRSHISHWIFQNFMQEFMLYFCLKAKSNLTTYLMAVVLLYLILRYISSSCVWSSRHDIMEQKAARKNTHAEIFSSPTL